MSLLKEMYEAGRSWLTWSAYDEIAVLKNELAIELRMRESAYDQLADAREHNYMPDIERELSNAQSVARAYSNHLRTLIRHLPIHNARETYLLLGEGTEHECAMQSPFADVPVCGICMKPIDMGKGDR